MSTALKWSVRREGREVVVRYQGVPVSTWAWSARRGCWRETSAMLSADVPTRPGSVSTLLEEMTRDAP